MSARRSKAFCWIGVGLVVVVKGWSGLSALTMVARVRVARSASRLWKLWTGRPSWVTPRVSLSWAAWERGALATMLSREASADAVVVVV